MTDDPFIRSTVTLTVLSRRPVEDLPLDDILYECDGGDMVLGKVMIEGETIDRVVMDAALVAAGSDPSFFADDDE